jgi:hypothetical protein
MSAVTVRLARTPGVILADGTLGPGCRVAPTVTDAMIPSERVALVRAMAELDTQAPRVPISGSIPAPGNLEPGTIGELIDSERGPVRAKLTAITYTLAVGDDGLSFTADSSVTMERLDD